MMVLVNPVSKDHYIYAMQKKKKKSDQNWVKCTQFQSLTKLNQNQAFESNLTKVRFLQKWKNLGLNTSKRWSQVRVNLRL